MKQLRITSAYSNKSRKMITFDVPDEVAQYFIEIFKKQNDTGELQAAVEGNSSMSVRLSILHAEQKF